MTLISTTTVKNIIKELTEKPFVCTSKYIETDSYIITVEEKSEVKSNE